VTTDDLEVEVTRVKLNDIAKNSTLGLELNIRAKKPLVVHVMGLDSAQGTDCSGGVMPFRIYREGIRSQDERITGVPRLELLGPGELGLFFRQSEIEERDLLRKSSAMLDLKIMGGEQDDSSDCVRLPIAQSTEPDEWEYMPSWFVGLGYRLQGFSRTVGWLDWSGAFVFRLGRWLGPVRLRAELGYWLSRADVDGDSRRRLHFVPAAIAADVSILRTGQSGIGIELGYELTTVIPDSAADDPVYLHGPRLGLKYTKYKRPPDWPAFRAREDGQSFGVEFYVTYLLGDDDSAGAFGFGVAIVGDYGF
jgi:hypothetical protein